VLLLINSSTALVGLTGKAFTHEQMINSDRAFEDTRQLAEGSL
jgi:hypothetical protein